MSVKSFQRIACIGARETPKEILLLMVQIGKYIASVGDYMTSGNALGADMAYATGANKINPRQVILYLPWASYNKELIVEGNRVTSDIKDCWMEVAKKHHESWGELSQGAEKMLARNAGILSLSDKCIAYINPNKMGGGGTGHGVSIAKEKKIPILLLNDETSLEDVKQFLKQKTNKQ